MADQIKRAYLLVLTFNPKTGNVMKNYSLAFIHLFLLSVLFISGCTEDDLIGPNGTNEDIRNKYIGNWLFDEQEATKHMFAFYSVEITIDPGNSAQVLLENFGNTGANYEPPCGLVFDSRIKIEDQTIGDGWQLKDAIGRLIEPGEMEWEYTLIVGGDAQNYTVTAALQ